MTAPRRRSGVHALLSTSAVIAIAGSVMAFAQAPAHAAGIGSGRALIRLETDSPKIVNEGSDRYRLVLPARTPGRWLGERTDARGRQTVRIGDLTAKKLSKRWTRFRYGSEGALATLTWNSRTERTTGVLIRMQKPRMTKSGVSVSFRAISSQPIPATLKDVALNIQRAAKSTRSTAAVDLVMQLWYSVDVEDPTSNVTGRIYNSGNDNTCWSEAMEASTTDSSDYTKDIPNNTCDTVAYTDGVATTLFPEGTSDGGESWLYLSLTPPSDSDVAPFVYNNLVYSWYTGTN